MESPKKTKRPKEDMMNGRHATEPARQELTSHGGAAAGSVQKQVTQGPARDEITKRRAPTEPTEPVTGKHQRNFFDKNRDWG